MAGFGNSLEALSDVKGGVVFFSPPIGELIGWRVGAIKIRQKTLKKARDYLTRPLPGALKMAPRSL